MPAVPTGLVPLRPEQRDVVDLARAFAREEIRPRARAADAVITSDSAQCCYYGALPHLPVGPEVRYLHPTGFGTLGYALPAALGAKAAEPHRQVLALSGDGGLQFTVREPATAVQLQLPLPLVVFDN